MRLKFKIFDNHLKIFWYDKDMIAHRELTISYKGSFVKYWGWRPF